MNIYNLSFKNLKRRKLRSILTMLGVIIGVIALVVLVGIGTGMTSYMKQETSSMSGDVTIMNSTGGENIMASSVSTFLTPNAVNQIKNMSQLYNITEESDFTSKIGNTPIYVIGTSDWSQVKINGTKGVVVNKNLADQLGYKIGSNITIGNESMIVTGTTTDDSGIPALIMDVDKALPLNDYQVSIITADTHGDPNTVKNDVENTVNGTTAYTKSDLSSQIDSIMNVVTIVVGAIASIALLVGVISIVNIMLVNVTERTREIGVLKAIGFTNKEILGSVLMEAGLIGFIGSVVGVIIAAIILYVGITVFAQQIGNMSLISMLPFWLIGGVIAGATFLSILAGLYPAWHASRLNVVEALRND
jgi:putative ABC transport system permease protein